MATLFQSVERVLEGFYSINTWAVLGWPEKTLARANRSERGSIELESSLRHPLEDQVVVGEGALVRGDAAQADQSEQDIEVVAQGVEGIGGFAEGERAG